MTYPVTANCMNNNISNARANLITEGIDLCHIITKDTGKAKGIANVKKRAKL